MLSYVFLTEWSKSTLLRNGSSLKICCDDPLGPYEFRTHAFWQRDEGFPLAEVLDLQQGG